MGIRTTPGRSETVNCRITLDEKNMLEANAATAGMTLSEYVRSRLLGDAGNATPSYSALAARVETVESDFDRRIRELEGRIGKRIQ